MNRDSMCNFFKKSSIFPIISLPSFLCVIFLVYKLTELNLKFLQSVVDISFFILIYKTYEILPLIIIWKFIVFIL